MIETKLSGIDSSVVPIEEVTTGKDSLIATMNNDDEIKENMAIIKDMLENRTIFDFEKVKEFFYFATTGNSMIEEKGQLLVSISKVIMKYKLVINFNDPETMNIQEYCHQRLEKKVCGKETIVQQETKMEDAEIEQEEKSVIFVSVNVGDDNDNKQKIAFSDLPSIRNGSNSSDDAEDDRSIDLLKPAITNKDTTAKPSKSNHGNFITLFVESLHQSIIRWLVAISMCAAKNPIRTLALIPTLSFALIIIGIMTNFNLVMLTLNSFAPYDALSVEHETWINDPATGWNIGRPPFAIMLHNGGDSVIGKQELLWSFEAINIIRNTPGYDEICSLSAYIDPFQKKNDDNSMMTKTTCEAQSIARFWEYNITLFDTAVQSDDDLIAAFEDAVFPDGSPMDFETIFGTNDLASIKAISTWIWIPESEKTPEFELLAMERLEVLKEKMERFAPNTKLEILAARSNADEFMRSLVQDLPLIPLMLCIMFAFTCLVFYRKDPVESRTLLGIGSVITIFLSILSGHGLMFIFGIPFTNLSMILPFIVIGIGLDDTFIITSEYFRTDSQKPTLERIHETMSSVAMSIFVTTCTTSLAFVFGTMSKVPAIYWLCYYGFPTIIFDFIYQITLFVAMLVIDEKRIRARRRDMCICFTYNTSDSGNDSIDNNCNDSEDEKVSENTIITASHDSRIVSSKEKNNIIKKQKQETKSDKGNDEEEFAIAIESPAKDKRISSPPPALLVDRIMTWYSEKILTPIMKIIVLCIFSALFLVCLYSTTFLEQEFKPTDLVPDDSYVKTFANAQENFNSQKVPINLFFRNIDQSDPFVQEQMMQYVDDMVALDQFGSPPTFCWVRDFQLLQDSNETLAVVLNDMTFNEKLDYLMENVPAINEIYGKNIVRDDLGNIIASRCSFFASVDLKEVKQITRLLEDQRDVAAKQPLNIDYGDVNGELNVFSYDDLYLMASFYEAHIPELVQTTVCSIIAVSLVALIFMPHWSASLIILPFMVVLYIDMLGMIQFAGLKMNVVTFISLVVSIGLLVDFVMHVLLRYYESEFTTRNEKAKDTLITMGSSILIGGTSTFLGLVPLAWSTSLILRNTYICFLAMVVLGILHGLVLLPVILSIIGPITLHPSESDDRYHHRNNLYATVVKNTEKNVL